jgi:hypothetical protein
VYTAHRTPKKTWRLAGRFTCSWTRESLLRGRWSCETLDATHPRFVGEKTALRLVDARNDVSGDLEFNGTRYFNGIYPGQLYDGRN